MEHVPDGGCMLAGNRRIVLRARSGAPLPRGQIRSSEDLTRKGKGVFYCSVWSFWPQRSEILCIIMTK